MTACYNFILLSTFYFKLPLSQTKGTMVLNVSNAMKCLKNIVTIQKHFKNLHKEATILDPSFKRKAFTFEEGC